MSEWLSRIWYQGGFQRWLLFPLSVIYQLVISLRHLAYQRAWFKSYKLDKPVIVVGNISVGGTGKTPFVIWLAELLISNGYKPGIVSRGYGAQAASYPQHVTANSAAEQVGDEPLMMASRLNCPIVVDPNRVRGAETLIHDYQCDVIISDDGLQHYRLQRDIEIAIVDGERRFGNGLCLPAGPLREPVSRLKSVDFTVFNGDDAAHFSMSLTQSAAVNLADPQQQRALSSFQGSEIHAVAGIGNPWRFFEQLQQQQIPIIAHAFEDHHQFEAKDLQFPFHQAILMTEKDAVKCRGFASELMWYVPVNAEISGDLDTQLLQKLRNKTHG